MSVAIVVAVIVHQDFVGDCLLSVHEQFNANFKLTCELPLSIRKGEQFRYLQGTVHHRIIDGDAFTIKHEKWVKGPIWLSLGPGKQRC